MELKPCPFCGGTNVYESYWQAYPGGAKNPIIFCNNCKVEFSVEDDSPFVTIEQDYEYRRKKTVESWNRRVTDGID